MSKKPRDNRPYIPPVKKITLNEDNLKGRWILLAVLTVIAVVSIGMGVYYALNREPGWQEVESASTELNCSGDFVFLYECGSTGVSATTEYKSVTALYSQLCQDAYAIFTGETESDKHNVYYLNSHVNEEVTVEPELYEALELVVESDCRDLFLAPVVREYNGVFLAQSDVEAALCDPMKDEQRMEYVREALSYVADPEMISLELLGENRVKLRVSQAYLDYADENEITVFLDFGWMKNAFIADYLADELTRQGCTNGYLVSYDGFTRNLDDRGTVYSINLFDRMENTVYMPAQLSYAGPMSIVSLRNYPLSEDDRWHYYAYEDGSVTSVYLSAATGAPVSSTDNLVSYSENKSCAQILMETAPLFLGETLDEQQLQQLADRGIHSIWAQENILYHTQPEADLTLLTDSGGTEYVLKAAQ